MGTPPVARRPAAAAASATLVVGLVSLGVWRAGAWPLLTFGPDYVPMAPPTGATFLAFGAAILARSLWPSSRTVFSAGRILTTGAVIAGILVTWLARFGGDLPWYSWFPGAGTQVGGVEIGSMSWLTVAAFVVTLIGFLSLERSAESPRAAWVSLGCTSAGALGGLVVLLGYASGTPVLYGGATIPMAFLTAITFVTLNAGLLLSGPIERVVGLWRPQEGVADPDGSAAFRRRIAVASVALALVIALSGFFFTRRDQTEARHSEHDQLQAVANLKANHIANWRHERLSEARFLMSTPAVVRDILALASRPGEEEARSRLAAWLTTIKGGGRYASVRVLDGRGATLLSVPEEVDPVVRAPAVARPRRRFWFVGKGGRWCSSPIRSKAPRWPESGEGRRTWVSRQTQRRILRLVSCKVLTTAGSR